MRSSGEREGTMISDEKRREVAERLRGLDERIDGVPLLCTKQEHDAMALCAIRAVVGKGDIFHLLADLIDRPSTTRHGKFRTKYGRETPCCEVCGYSIGDMRWGYCPKCGAEVVE